MNENINICLCFDKKYREKAINLIKSILKSTKIPEKIVFNILVDKDEKNDFIQSVSDIKFNYVVREFIIPERLQELINKLSDKLQTYDIKKSRFREKRVKQTFYIYTNYIN